MDYQVNKTEEEWRRELGPERFEVLRRSGTERPWAGEYVDCHKDGTYHCGACGAELFDSATKFESGSGWPSFYEPIESDAIETVLDRAHGMSRVEVRCRRCGSHLGHVFEDGPEPTGLRYCMNSLSLSLEIESTAPAVLGDSSVPGDKDGSEAREIATFGAGCFWGVEEAFRTLPGVVTTAVGYAGGHSADPTYKQVCSHRTGHAEVVQVGYDPDRITYDDLLDVFWAMHDPTTLDRQGPDVGDQYRSVIFFHSPEQRQAAEASKARHQPEVSRPIVTEITAAPTFWRAEDYHQNYLAKRNQPACDIAGAKAGALTGAIRGLFGRS